MSNGVVKTVKDLYLEELGITSPKEIDIEAIAFYKDAVVKQETLKGCEARIIGYGDKAIITINDQSERPRQKFSIGHELGHWFTDKGKIGYLCTYGDMDPSASNLAPREINANIFASELLIPSYLIKEALKGSPLNHDTVGLVTDKFDTSFIVALRKTISANTHMGFFARYNSKGERKYFEKNKDLHYYFSPPRQAPVGSCVSELINLTFRITFRNKFFDR